MSTPESPISKLKRPHNLIRYPEVGIATLRPAPMLVDDSIGGAGGVSRS